MKKKKSKKKKVVVSGGFDPIHVGHLRMFETAKKLGDELVVIINSDEWLIRKKGACFMKAKDRAELIQAFKCVDRTYISNSVKTHVSDALRAIKPHIFANGGDRRGIYDIPETKVCEELGIKMVFGIGGGKIRASSDLLENYCKLIFWT